jgi:hypothetical protein
LFWFSRKKAIPASSRKERRMLPRWAIYAKAKIRLKDEDAYVDCEVRNLSMRGFCLATSLKLPECCPALTLYFNEKYFFTAETNVIWRKDHDGRHSYGMRFVKIRDTDKEKIYQMMHQDFPQHLQKYK